MCFRCESDISFTILNTTFKQLSNDNFYDYAFFKTQRIILICLKIYDLKCSVT